MDLMIKNGMLVTAQEMYVADIAVKDGKIMAIGQNLTMEAAQTIDAKGKLVLPGANDVHTHLAIILVHGQQPVVE